MTTRTLALLSAALLTAATATAQDRRREQPREDRFTDWTRQGFAEVDRNRDGRISRDEWRWSRIDFDEHDRNADSLLTRREFTRRVDPRGRSGNRSRFVQQSDAYWAGYDRGHQEGRAAGREDRERNQGWDLEGQRELDTADSGYTPAVGPRNEYQAGYREGFRLAYREGYGR